MHTDYCTSCEEYSNHTFNEERYRWECTTCGKGGLTYWS